MNTVLMMGIVFIGALTVLMVFQAAMLVTVNHWEFSAFISVIYTMVLLIVSAVASSDDDDASYNLRMLHSLVYKCVDEQQNNDHCRLLAADYVAKTGKLPKP